jgi:hypothetical protein
MKALTLSGLLLCLSLPLGCRSDSDGGIGDGLETPPIIKNLAINMGVAGVNPGGAFVVAANRKDFLEFGAEVHAGDGDTKILPTFEYRVRSDADVFAPADGIITRLEYQSDSNDWFVWIQSHAGADWIVEIDHILDLADGLSEGNAIQAGDLLGKPGTWGGGLGRVELLIVDGDNYHCPFSLFDPALIDDYRAQVTDLMNAIESENATGEAFYDQANMVVPGCNEWSYSD